MIENTGVEMNTTVIAQMDQSWQMATDLMCVVTLAVVVVSVIFYFKNRM